MVRKGELRLGAVKELLDVPKEQQVGELKKKKEEAKAKAKGTSHKVPKPNQEMTDLDDFKKKWQAFNDMQRRAFVTTLKDELAKILDYVRQQEAMVGAATANAA